LFIWQGWVIVSSDRGQIGNVGCRSPFLQPILHQKGDIP
jgi:hypothetical protein